MIILLGKPQERCYRMTLDFNFIRKYQRQTIAFQQYIFDLCKENIIENVSTLRDKPNFLFPLF